MTEVEDQAGLVGEIGRKSRVRGDESVSNGVRQQCCLEWCK